MPKYLTTEADLNFPVPNAERVAAQLRAMYDGRNPVTARAVAQAFGLGERTIAAVLRRAERCGMVQSVKSQGWIPLNA